MGVQTLLLLAGAVAAAVVTTAVMSYRLSAGRRKTASIQTLLSSNSETSATADLFDSNRLEAAENTRVPRKGVSEAMNLEQISSGLTPVPEAPAPFPEDALSSSQTAIPTDTTAFANMTSPAQGMPAVLVIAKPKRRVRSPKRLPTGNSTVTPRRRSTRGKSPVLDPSLVSVGQCGDPGQQKN